MRKVILLIIFTILFSQICTAIKLNEDTINDMSERILLDCSSDQNIGADCICSNTKCECESLYSFPHTKENVINLINLVDDKWNKGGTHFAITNVLLCVNEGIKTHWMSLQGDCYLWDSEDCINEIKEGDTFNIQDNSVKIETNDNSEVNYNDNRHTTNEDKSTEVIEEETTGWISRILDKLLFPIIAILISAPIIYQTDKLYKKFKAPKK